MPSARQELVDDEYCPTPTKHVRIQTFPVRRRVARPNSTAHPTTAPVLATAHTDAAPCSTNDEADAPATAPFPVAALPPATDSSTGAAGITAKRVSRRTFPTRRRGAQPQNPERQAASPPPPQTQPQTQSTTTSETGPVSTDNDESLECSTPTKRVHVRTFPVRRRVPRTKSDERKTAGANPNSSTAKDDDDNDDDAGVGSSRAAPRKQNVVLYDDLTAHASAKPTPSLSPSPARTQTSLFSRVCEQPQRSAITLIDETRMPFLKAGDVQNETLLEFLGRDNRHLTWQKLLEAALSLRQLHEQDIVHGRLQCRNILITADVTQQARVRNFGAHFRPNHVGVKGHLLAESSPASTVSSCWDEEELEAVRWRAPECLVDDGWSSGGGCSERASKEADVFSLGMCILEAVTRAEPWGAVSDDVVPVLLQAGRLPSRPAGHFRDDQWELIERMCTKDPTRRVALGFVIKRLRVFAALERDARVARQREAPRVLYAA